MTMISHSKPTITEKDMNNVINVLKSGFVGAGDKTEEVKKLISGLLDKKETFFLNSGTSSLFLSLKALHLKEDDEIIISNYSCPTLYNQICNIPATPVLVDTDENSFFINEKQIFEKINNRTKAVLINHPFGHFENALLKIKNAGVFIIEDITHSLGAKAFNGIKTGSLGDIVICSFGSAKLITSGTGGSISTSIEDIIIKLRAMLDYEYVEHDISYNVNRHNLKLGDLNASLLLSQLGQLDYFISKRKILSKIYYDNLKNPYPFSFSENSIYYRFFIHDDPAKIRKILNYLSEKNILTVIGGFRIISNIIGCDENFPHSVKAHKSFLSIPIYPSLSNNEIHFIVKSMKEAF